MDKKILKVMLYGGALMVIMFELYMVVTLSGKLHEFFVYFVDQFGG